MILNLSLELEPFLLLALPVELAYELAQIARFVLPLGECATQRLVGLHQFLLLAEHMLHFHFLLLAIACGRIFVLLFFSYLAILHAASVGARSLFGL